MEFNHANHLYKVEGQVNFKEKMTISLNNFSDFPVHYTTDGTPPNEESKVYTKPVAVNGDMHLKAASFNASGKIKDSEYEETVTLSKACTVVTCSELMRSVNKLNCVDWVYCGRCQ